MAMSNGKTTVKPRLLYRMQRRRLNHTARITDDAEDLARLEADDIKTLRDAAPKHLRGFLKDYNLIEILISRSEYYLHLYFGQDQQWPNLEELESQMLALAKAWKGNIKVTFTARDNRLKTVKVTFKVLGW